MFKNPKTDESVVIMTDKAGTLYKIYAIRYFILHLVKWDMQYKFRRSKLGILWTLLQPLFLALIIALIFGTVFGIPMGLYAPYILSGFIGWDLIFAGVISNSFSFMRAESYIRQYAHPLMIYPIRETLVSICTFMIASISLVIWIAIINPYNLITAALCLPLTVILMFCLVLPLSMISSQIHVRFRDYPHIFGIFMQALWYVSPVFFMEDMFKGNMYLHNWFLYNPITSILNLIREPFLYGKIPSLFTYGYIFIMIVFFSIIACLVNRKYSRNVIFYI